MPRRNWVLTVATLSAARFVAVIGVSLGWFASNPGAPSLNGEWVMVSGQVDGEEISGATLTIDDSLGGVFDDSEISPIKGEIFCNTFSGESWDELFSTLSGCFENGGTPEQSEPPDSPGRWPAQAMLEALSNGPRFEGDQLVFEITGVRLAYERAG